MTFISCTNSSYFSLIFFQLPCTIQYLLSFLQGFSFRISLQDPWLGSLFLDAMFFFWFMYSGCWNQSPSKQLRTIEWEYRVLEWFLCLKIFLLDSDLTDNLITWQNYRLNSSSWMWSFGIMNSLSWIWSTFPITYFIYSFSVFTPTFPYNPYFSSTFSCTLEYFLKFLELILIPNFFSFSLSFYFHKFIVFRLEIYQYMKLISNLKASFYS